MDWQGLLAVGKFGLGLSVTEFWGLTFAEYWALHDHVFKQGEKKKMSSEDLKALNERWGQFGNIRRVSSQSNGRNSGAKDRVK